MKNGMNLKSWNPVLNKVIGCYYVLSNLYNPKELEDKTQFLLDCCFLINYHMFPFSWNTDSLKNKWKRRFGEYKYNMLMRFHECDVTRVEVE